METVNIEGWKVELFSKSVAVSVVNTPFLTGYSEERFDPEKFRDREFISLYTSPRGLGTRAVRLSGVSEVRCTPLYASKAIIRA